MSDDFDSYTPGLESPPENFVEVTPNDTTDLESVPRGLLLDAPGNVNVTTKGGQTLVVPLQAGYNPGRFVRVWETNTDERTIVAYW